MYVHVQRNDWMERTEMEPNWKRFFDAYCSPCFDLPSIVKSASSSAEATLSGVWLSLLTSVPRPMLWISVSGFGLSHESRVLRVPSQLASSEVWSTSPECDPIQL